MRDIDLHAKPVAALGMVLLAKYLKKQDACLQNLNLDGCQIGSEGLLIFSDLTKCTRGLTTAILSNNRYVHKHDASFRTVQRSAEKYSWMQVEVKGYFASVRQHTWAS